MPADRANPFPQFELCLERSGPLARPVTSLQSRPPRACRSSPEAPGACCWESRVAGLALSKRAAVRSRKPRLATARPLLATADGRTVRPLPKTGDPELSTPEHRAWALAVKRRAGWKCEDCGAQGGNGGARLYADHIHERSDGGPLDGPGKCLCASCHSTKTARERAKRHGLI